MVMFALNRDLCYILKRTQTYPLNAFTKVWKIPYIYVGKIIVSKNFEPELK